MKADFQNAKSCIIALSSVTYAMKAERLLSDAGIAASIIKLEAGQTRSGCAYGISLSCGHASAAVQHLSKHGIPYSEVLR